MLQQSLSGQWFFCQAGGKERLPGTVPGGVHTDLLALGNIPDPFVADNEKQVQWIAECDWEYQRSFTVDPHLAAEEKQYLVCDGLDTVAEVTLNGQLLGSADNMFRAWKWEVSDLLRPGENDIRILFRAPLAYIRACQALDPLNANGVNPGGPHLRKAPCHWGWDWGPILPVIGIWKDIRLEGYSVAKLEDVHIRQVHFGGNISIRAELGLEWWENKPVQVCLRITAPNGTIQSQAGEPREYENGRAICRLETSLEDPQVWWPNGYGSQPLYSVAVTLESGAAVLDEREYQVGLRTVELQREPDEWGESFTFIVNGVPLFAKGANWIPADALPTRISDDHLEHLISSAAGAHMNMLRVWGGGYYPDTCFCDLCDRYGILIWQDFMFACGIYPADAEFAENVRIEAVENVRRLRHHASLALWCGNNEMEQGWVDWGWNNPANMANQRLKAGYDRMFHHLLPEVVASEDPDTPYWPSSASSGIPFAEPNGEQRGDSHYWDVWHRRKPFSAYRQQYPRFMSEFGFQSLPPYKTIQAFAAPADQNMTSYVMEHHQRSGNGNTLIISQMADHFRLPKDFPSLVYLSMVLQAEGIRNGVEHWRRNRARVSGTLYWQLNDCWPVASWSSLDYYGRWKALHYAAKRFYAPLLLSIHDQGLQMDVHITSDLTTPWTGTLRWRLETLAGQICASGEEPVFAASLANQIISSLDFSNEISDENRREMALVCELWQGSQQLSYTLSTFAPDKHLALADPNLEIDIRLVDDTLAITLTGSSLARFVELSLEGADVLFSDSYFDLPAGMTRIITARRPGTWTVDRARQALRIRSLVNSYE